MPNQILIKITMVTIKKIEINGFFGKGDFEWILDPVVNILGGKNGSGKTSIFKLCYALLSKERIFDDQDKHFSTLFEKAIITFSNSWTLTWEKKEQKVLTLDMSGAVPQLHRIASVIRDENGQERKFAELKPLVEVYLINSFEQHISRAVQYAQQPKAFSTDDPMMIDLLIEDQINIRNREFSRVMEEMTDAPKDDEEARTSYIRNHKLIYESLGYFLTEYDKPYISTFDFSKNQQQFSYKKLSMGEKQVLLLLLMVSNTKQLPCIFFMDEPDLSMHIDWKEELVTRLHELNPNMQIILSTHAPSVITGWHDKVKEVDQLIKR